MTLSKAHRAYFNMAKEVSKLADYPYAKIGCIAVLGHHIVSSGFNTHKSSPLQKMLNRERFSADTIHSMHAEVMCLKPLMGRKDISFKDVTLYIFRGSKNNDPMLARPCRSCEKLIRDLKIKKVFFSTYGGYASEEFYNME